MSTWPLRPGATAHGVERDGAAAADRSGLLALAPLAAGLLLWALSLGAIDLAHLGGSGLLGVLPATWYLAFALLVGGAVHATWVAPARGWVIAAYVGAVILVLFGTIPAVADAPQYPWVYKHIGVTRLIQSHGGIAPGADIYNHWPGFFAVAAAFCRVAGLGPDGVFTVAAWFEPLFMAIDALLVAAIARAVTRDVRVAGAGALGFVLINWVGQTYFSPQALAFALGLALVLVVLRGLGRAGIAEPLGWSPRAVVGVAVGLDLAIVVTHQLTPYVLLAQLAALCALGAARAWRLVGAAAAITALFLVVNLDAVQGHFTLLTSLDPLSNLRTPGLYDVAPVAGKRLNGMAGMLLALLAFGGGTLAAAWLARGGDRRRPAALLALALAPLAVVLAQNYGGEATLRVILFGAPWTAILIAWAIARVPARALRVALGAGAAAALALPALPAFLGAAQLNIVPRDAVDVSQAFYRDAPRGSVLMLAGPGFPLRVGARYDQFAGPVGDADPNLLHGRAFRSRPLGARDVPAVVRAIRRYSRNGYLAFSATEERWAATFGLTPPGALSSLERAVARSHAFVLWRATPGARIYRLTRR